MIMLTVIRIVAPGDTAFCVRLETPETHFLAEKQ
jgi:hypothetical protein